MGSDGSAGTEIVVAIGVGTVVSATMGSFVTAVMGSLATLNHGPRIVQDPPLFARSRTKWARSARRGRKLSSQPEWEPWFPPLWVRS